MTDNRQPTTNKEVYFLMNNLTTRKIVLGLLMALVLTFSVQGIADALTLTESDGDGDLQTVGVGEFTVEFSVGLTGNNGQTDLKDSNYEEVPDANLTASQMDRPYYFIDNDPGGTNDGYTGESRISNSAAKYNNNEAVSISVRGANIVGLDTTGNPITPTGSHTLREDPYGSGGTELTASVTLRLAASRAGEVTITISDATPNEDFERGTSRGANLVITTYVVKHRLDVGQTETIGFLGVTNGVGSGYDMRQDVEIYRGDGRHNPVVYSVSGGGELYIKEGTREGESGDNTRGASLTTSSGASVWLSMGLNNSNVVTARVANNDTTQAVYIYGRPTLVVTTNPDPLEGSPGEGDANIITAVVHDQNDDGTPGNGIDGVPVKFDVADKSATGGYLIPQPDDLGADEFATNIVDARNNPIRRTDVPPATRTLYVRADQTNNNAVVGFQFGTAAGKSEINVSIAGRGFNITKDVEATVTGDATTQLSIDSNTQRSGNTKLFDLVALVERDGEPLRGVRVTFQTRFGRLENTPTGISTVPNPDGGATINDSTKEENLLQITEVTDHLGKAQVIYNIGNNSGRQEIDASIYDTNVNLRQEITFVINGAATRTPTPTPTPTPTVTPRLTISVTGTGATRAVTVTATDAQGADVPGLGVSLSGTALATPRLVTTGTPITVTLPTTPGDYTLLASAPGFTLARVNLTVAAAPQPGTLTIERVGDRIGNQQSIRVTAQTSDGTPHSGDLTVTLTGAVNPPTVTTLNGSVAVIATLPTTTGAHVLTVSATGYGSDSVIVPAGTGQPTGGSQPTTRTVVGAADSLEIDGNRQLSGTVNQAMRLRVRVLDANGNGVDDVRVTFRVLAPGRGRLSQRGNGRATQDQTDRNGYASANFTPTDDGNIIVRASAAGVPASVTFIIDVGEADDDDPEPPTPSRDVPPSREINPVVHVGAASRPPMLWVDGGAIYALVGASEQRFAPSVDNAMNIVIGGGKVYWTEKTGESSGTINSANLNGSDVTELTSIQAVPMGIAVDTAGSKLYWTNSRGRIQSANLDGSGITNVLLDLPSPMDIALGTWSCVLDTRQRKCPACEPHGSKNRSRYLHRYGYPR